MDKVVLEQFLNKYAVFSIRADNGMFVFEGRLTVVGDTSFAFVDKYGTPRSFNLSSLEEVKEKSEVSKRATS